MDVVISIYTEWNTKTNEKPRVFSGWLNGGLYSQNWSIYHI